MRRTKAQLGEDLPASTEAFSALAGLAHYDVLEAAGELLLGHGLDNVSMDVISERAGVSKADLPLVAHQRDAGAGRA